MYWKIGEKIVLEEQNGKRQEQIMIAGYKNCVELYPHPTTMEKFDSELSEYKPAKGFVQFPLE
ncbi:MAG: hypothetical protein CSB55_01030 [Candidatus Cloacimonadota bacterium]|nr:MAG: hypothetical protein CSB55_01030 [Candidatus Cloacimonadota bacterium]